MLINPLHTASMSELLSFLRESFGTRNYGAGLAVSLSLGFTHHLVTVVSVALLDPRGETSESGPSGAEHTAG